MKINAASDLHIDETSARCSLEKLINSGNGADVNIIAGDLLGYFNEYLLHIVFEFFEPLPGKKLLTPGNHDLWTEEDSLECYRRFGEIAKEHDWHMLDDGPAYVNGAAFVGNIGWYDYSLKSDDLPDYDYSQKLLRINETEYGWVDREAIKWPHTDEEFVEVCATRLRDDIEKAQQNGAENIVVVSHHLPYKDLTIYTSHNKGPGWKFANAYMGSSKLGDIISSCDKVQAVIHGHSHVRAHYPVDGKDCYDVAVSPDDETFVPIEV